VCKNFQKNFFGSLVQKCSETCLKVIFSKKVFFLKFHLGVQDLENSQDLSVARRQLGKILHQTLCLNKLES